MWICVLKSYDFICKRKRVHCSERTGSRKAPDPGPETLSQLLKVPCGSFQSKALRVGDSNGKFHFEFFSASIRRQTDLIEACVRNWQPGKTTMSMILSHHILNSDGSQLSLFPTTTLTTFRACLIWGPTRAHDHEHYPDRTRSIFHLLQAWDNFSHCSNRAHKQNKWKLTLFVD